MSSLRSVLSRPARHTATNYFGRAVCPSHCKNHSSQNKIIINWKMFPWTIPVCTYKHIILSRQNAADGIDFVEIISSLWSIITFIHSFCFSIYFNAYCSVHTYRTWQHLSQSCYFMNQVQSVLWNKQKVPITVLLPYHIVAFSYHDCLHSSYLMSKSYSYSTPWRTWVLSSLNFKIDTSF